MLVLRVKQLSLSQHNLTLKKQFSMRNKIWKAADVISVNIGHQDYKVLIQLLRYFFDILLETDFFRNLNIK